MPFKSETIKISGTKFDRRIKLSLEDKREISSLKGKFSQRELARMFGVSRRLVVFILFPERLLENRKSHDSSKYYDKDKWRGQMREHRNYKQKLFLEGKIELEKEKPLTKAPTTA